MDVTTLADQLFFVTAYLEGKAENGSGRAGTGFVYTVPTDRGDANFLVSNKHVFAGLSELTVRMVRAGDDQTLQLGSATQITLTDFNDGLWKGHPDASVDVAALPLGTIADAMVGMGAPPFFRSIPSDISLTDITSRTLDSIEEVVFVGYPNGIYDDKNFTPVVRRGSTATPISIDYRGEPAFLIDASVFPGSSGSPVFVLNQGSYTSRNGGIVIGQRFIFLGVLAAVHVRQVVGSLIQLPATVGVQTSETLDLGIVYRAQAIDQTVDLFLEGEGLVRLASGAEVQEETTPVDEQLAQDIGTSAE